MMCDTYVSDDHLMKPKHIERTGWYIDGWDPKTPEWQLHGRHGWVPQAALHCGELPQAALPPYPVPPPVQWPNSVPKAAAPPPPPVSATGTVPGPPGPPAARISAATALAENGDLVLEVGALKAQLHSDEAGRGLESSIALFGAGGRVLEC